MIRAATGISDEGAPGRAPLFGPRRGPVCGGAAPPSRRDGAQPLQGLGQRHGVLLAGEQLIQQGIAALLDIPVGGDEIPGVPRVIHITGVAGKVQQPPHLPCRVAAEFLLHRQDMAAGHPQQVVKLRIVLRADIAGAALKIGDVFPLQLAHGAVMHRAVRRKNRRPGALAGYGVPQPAPPCQLPKDKFRHGAAADIAVAYEKYIFHKVSSLYFSRLFYYITFSPFRQSGAVNLWYFPAGVIFFGRNSVFMLDFRNCYCYNEGTN